jgi:LysR family transcriptional regulator, hca operon transcriptional activator
MRSTQVMALLPIYATTFLPESVTTRPLKGPSPKIDLSFGYRNANRSSILKLFLARIDELKTQGLTIMTKQALREGPQ